MSDKYLSTCTSLDSFPRLPGEHNDRGRFQRAIDATASGGTLLIPPGQYTADSLKVGQSIQLLFSEQSILTATEKNQDILTIEGSRDAENYVLAKPVHRGDCELQLTQTPTGWCPGDMIVLTDDASRFSDKQVGINTEVHEIARVESNNIILCDFVRLPKGVSKLGVNVYRVQPVENVRIKNFSFQMQEGSIRGRGLFMNFVRNCEVSGFKGERSAGSAIQVRKAMHIRIEQFQIRYPQVTGSGQGYGVQMFGGCNHVVIQDGYTVRCRHAVDLDGCFDAFISKVFDYHSTGAAFMMSHNGYSSDIHFDQCKTYYTLGSGFVAYSQGFAKPLQCTFFNFTITNCEVMMNSSAGACVYWYSPCQQAMVRDCKLSYFSKKSTIGLNNAGVRLYPAKSDILISGCEISGLRRGIALQVAGLINYKNDQSSITIRDTTIRNCFSAILVNRGFNRKLKIYNLDCDQIVSALFEFVGKGSFQEWVIDGLSLSNSGSCQFYTGEYGNPSHGMIRNIHTDRCHFYLSNKPTWSLNHTDLFLHGDGETILLQGSPTISSKSPLPDGLVEGQRLTIITTSGTWKLHCGKNMIFQRGQSAVTLNKTIRLIKLVWRAGKWFQV